MLFGKHSRIFFTKIRMIATASFGDVMEQSRQDQKPWLVIVRCQLAAEWEFMGVFHNPEAAHIAKHHQDVLINCVHMKQIMLHLPNYFPKGR